MIPLRLPFLALLNIADVLRSMDRKRNHSISSLFLDFSKALDTINHETLSILKYVGMFEAVVNFFQNYIINRYQMTTINDIKSTLLKIFSGVS